CADPHGTERQEVATTHVQRGVLASCHAFPSSPTSRTAYPACARRAAGEPPPRHITISPPNATIIPPYHTHQPRALIPNRHATPQGTERQEVPPPPVQRGVLASCPAFPPSPPSRPAYPACARRAAGEPPPGHITISPPNATIIPPYHTHQTSGLIVKRNTACSVPATVPPSTPYRSSRSMLMIAGSVEGWDVGRPSPSTCCRFSGVRNPIGLPLRRTSTVAAVICRFKASYCEIPRCVRVYVWPYGLRSDTDSPGRRVASVSVLNAMPAKATNRITMPVCTM